MYSYLRLKNDSGIDKLIQDFFKGRIAKYWIKLLEIIPEKESLYN